VAAIEEPLERADDWVWLVDHSNQIGVEGERLPLSTEILESSFGLDKQQERQHSQSGFTSLIATFGALLRPTTPAMIRSAFERVKMKDVRDWLQKNCRRL
jgi:hypothetical protein